MKTFLDRLAYAILGISGLGLATFMGALIYQGWPITGYILVFLPMIFAFVWALERVIE